MAGSNFVAFLLKLPYFFSVCVTISVLRSHYTVDGRCAPLFCGVNADQSAVENAGQEVNHDSPDMP